MSDQGGEPPCLVERICDGCGSVMDTSQHVCGPPVHVVRRVIVGYHQDVVGDWVAELSCLHTQHVRHRPPFQLQPWIGEEEGRRERLGSAIDCSLCGRTDLPDKLEVVRTIGPFDKTSLPAALRHDHVVADATWAVIAVEAGSILFTMQSEPVRTVILAAGDRQPIPPAVAHRLTPISSVRLTIQFMTRR